jgi:hypothetical protein
LSIFKDMDNPTGWDKVSYHEIAGVIGASGAIGIVKVLVLIRKAKRVRIIDILLEPALAIFAGMLAWMATEYTNVPDLLQGVFTSLAAWGGPAFINRMERKYFGTSTDGDTHS